MTEITHIEYPVWQLAMENILKKTKENGHGMVFAHEDLKGWMGIKEPKTIEESQQMQFDYLQGLEKLKDELLIEHDIYIYSVRGQGYVVLHPDDQVKKPIDKSIRKIGSEIKKAKDALVNIKTEMLSLEVGELRLRRMSRIAFLKSAVKKRKFKPIEYEKKMIGVVN